MEILVTGGTGFIGKPLCAALNKAHHNVTVLSRNPRTVSDRYHAISSLHELDSEKEIDVVINLAGATIAKRWTVAYKKMLIDSRVETTHALTHWMRGRDQKPKVFISASAVGYYGRQDAKPVNEHSAAHQEFQHDLCAQWEAAAIAAEHFGVRTCIMRLGVVLEKNGGALAQMLLPFQLGLGGPVGSGRQYFSWIHRDDVIAGIFFLMEHPKLNGAFNFAAPEAVTNREFAKHLGHALHRPACLPMPGPVVKVLFGEMGDALLLHGQNVVPQRLREAGFEFKYPTVSSALSAVFR